MSGTPVSAHAPRGLTARGGPEARTIHLSWQAPASASVYPVSAYEVFRGNASGSLSLVGTVPGGTATFDDTGLPNGVVRFYKVRAVTANGAGPFSLEANVRTIEVAPTPPRNLKAEGGPALGRMTLSWEHPEDEGGPQVTSYRVYRANATGGTFTLVATVDRAAGHVDTGLANATVYRYEVVAVNAVGPSNASNVATGKTWSLPTAPRNLAAAPGPGVGRITLTWNASTDDGGAPDRTYVVYRANASDAEYVEIARVGDALNFTDSGLKNGVVRHYMVSRATRAGESARAGPVNARTADLPSAPLALAATPAPGAIRVSWSIPSSDGGATITAYRVYRGAASGSGTLYVSVPATAGKVLYEITDTTCPYAVCHYAVAAENLIGEGPRSNGAFAVPGPKAVAIPDPSVDSATARPRQTENDGSANATAENGGDVEVSGSTSGTDTAEEHDGPAATDADTASGAGLTGLNGGGTSAATAIPIGDVSRTVLP
jgi:fibronectin type 3 domain-containing protein